MRRLHHVRVFPGRNSARPMVRGGGESTGNGRIQWASAARSIRHVVAGLVLITSGCTSPYMTNRVRDAADIATVSFGYGLGARARVSAIGTGFFANRDLVGLRGGHLGLLMEHDGAIISDLDLIGYRMEVFSPPSETVDRRHKDFIAVGIGPWTRGGEFELFRRAYPTPQFYTQIEVAAGLGPSVRLGLNPGELVDFLLGTVGIDLYDDDIEYGTGSEGSD